MEENRVYIYDNLKAILITLVVTGHLYEAFLANRGAGNILYILVYSFHMAAFVYCSGVFSSFKLKRDIGTLLLPYVVFQVLYVLFAKVFYLGGIYNPFIRPYWILWFLPCVFVWRFVCSLLKKVSKGCFVTVFIISLIFSFAEGFCEHIGYEFSLSRLIYFFSFFMLGAAQKRFLGTEKVLAFAKNKVTLAICLAVIVCYMLFVLTRWQIIDHGQLYYAFSYEGDSFNVCLRLLSWVFSLAMIIFLLGVLPNKKTFLTQMGQKTIYIYLLHGFFVKLFRKFSIYEIFPSNLLYVCTFGAMLLYLLSRDFVKKAYDKLFFYETFNKK